MSTIKCRVIEIAKDKSIDTLTEINFSLPETCKDRSVERKNVMTNENRKSIFKPSIEYLFVEEG